MVRIPYSGRTGYLQNFTNVSNWGVDLKVSDSQYASSSTKGASAQLEGWNDWSADFQVNNHLAVVIPGQNFNFGGSLDGVNGITGPVIVDSVGIKWDIEGAKQITQDVRCSGNGPYTVGACAASDTSLPNPLVSFGTFGMLQIVGGVNTRIPGVKSMDLSLSCRNVEFKDSDTAGWTYRIKGSLEGQVSFSVNVSDLSLLPAPNSFGSVQLYVNDSIFWQIAYLKFGGISGIKADRESGAVVGATLNAKFSAYHNGVEGNITGPSGSVLWPFAVY